MGMKPKFESNNSHQKRPDIKSLTLIQGAAMMQLSHKSQQKRVKQLCLITQPPLLHYEGSGWSKS